MYMKIDLAFTFDLCKAKKQPREANGQKCLSEPTSLSQCVLRKKRSTTLAIPISSTSANKGRVALSKPQVALQ